MLEELKGLPFPVREEIKNGYGQILRANMVFRTGRNNSGYETIQYTTLATVSRTGRNEIRVREDIESDYDLPCWKKLNTVTERYITMAKESRTGIN